MDWVKQVVQVANEAIVHVCQFLAIVVISIGIIKALKIYLADVLTPGRSAEAVQASRMEVGHAFSLALSFLIGASILKTTLAPNWSDIGQLAAIIAIRTLLNYFLLHDISLQNRSAGEHKPIFGGMFGRRKKPPSTETEKG